MWLKACPKCRGDLTGERDKFGPFISCIQCGYLLNEKETRTLVAATRRSLLRRKQAQAEAEAAYAVGG